MPAKIPRGVWMLGFVSLFMDVSSEMIHSLLPVFMVSGLGASMIFVGIVEGVAEATALIVKVFSGTLSDYLGRRKGLTVLGYGLGAISKPVFALALTLAFAGDFRTVFWFALIPAAISVLLLVFGVQEPDRPAGHGPLRSPVRWRTLHDLGGAFWWVGAVGGVFTLARFSEAFLILRARQFGLVDSWAPL